MLRPVVLASMLSASFFSSALHADHSDHPGKIVGPGIDLVWENDNLAGKIDGFDVTGQSLTDSYGMKLHFATSSGAVDTVFARSNQVLGAHVVTTQDGHEVSTDFRITAVVAREGKIQGQLDAQEFTVHVTAESMDGNHYVEPTFNVDIAGQKYTFRLEDSSVCIGCATKIVFAVLTTKRALRAW